MWNIVTGIKHIMHFSGVKRVQFENLWELANVNPQVFKLGFRNSTYFLMLHVQKQKAYWLIFNWQKKRGI